MSGDEYVDDSYVWEEYGIDTHVVAAIAMLIVGLVVAASIFQPGPGGRGHQLGVGPSTTAAPGTVPVGNLFNSAGTADFVPPPVGGANARVMDPELMLRARLARRRSTRAAPRGSLHGGRSTRAAARGVADIFLC